LAVFDRGITEPAGVTLLLNRNNLTRWRGQARRDYGIFRVNTNPTWGTGMTLDPYFFVDLDNVQKQNTVGAARPHQIFFDPGVPEEFGHH
jgi:hypothetical protein